MKKYILSALVAMFTVIGAYADEMVTVYSLFVNTVGGDKVEYAFDKKPVATFDGDNLVITVADAPGVEYPMSDVKNITLEGKEVSEVADAETSHLQIRVTNQYVFIRGVEGTTSVKVYSISGALVAEGIANPSGEVEISIENLAQGVYVVALPGHSFKFVK